jgi:hypothetical protein
LNLIKCDIVVSQIAAFKFSYLYRYIEVESAAEAASGDDADVRASRGGEAGGASTSAEGAEEGGVADVAGSVSLGFAYLDAAAGQLHVGSLRVRVVTPLPGDVRLVTWTPYELSSIESYCLSSVEPCFDAQ